MNDRDHCDELLAHTWDPLILIERRRYPAAPPRVEYRLSPLDATFADGPMHELGRWILAQD